MTSRAVSMAACVQRRLEAMYGLDPAPCVEGFARPADEGEREEVLVRDEGHEVEVQVVLPAEGLRPAGGALSLDVLCQIVEGVSHFVYLAGRIEVGVPTTRLELELQAEVDKFVVLGWAALERRDVERTREIHDRLYEGVVYLHDAASEEGERYRVANALAARFCDRLGARRADRAQPGRAREALRVFHRARQDEKIWLATAA